MWKYKAQFWTGDIETREGKFWFGGIYNGKKYYEFEKEDEFMKFVLELNNMIFFHYLDSDIRTIFNWCLKEKIKFVTPPIISGDRKIIEWKIGTTIFRDSFILMSEDLNELAKSFNLKIQELEVRDYQKFKKAKLRKYLKNDVIGLHQILKKFYDFIGWKNFKKKTIASISLAKFKETDRNSFDRITEYPIYPRDDDFLRQAYFSGYYADFKTKFENKNKKILKIDVNSFYGSVMRDNFFPWGHLVKPKVEEISKLKNELGIVKAEAKVPKLKFGFLPIKTEQGIKYPTKGTIRGIWTTPEILFAEKLGYKFKFKKGIFWPFQDYLFKKYINQYAKIKEESRGAKRVIAKNLLVSLYGKFAQRRDVSTFKRVKKPIPNRFYLDENLTIVEEKRYVRTPYSHPEISVFTTAYARIWMYKICQQIGWNNIFALINDSLIIEDKLTKEFKKKWFDENEIGKFKIEAQIEKGILLGRGFYALKDMMGREIIKTQSLPKEIKKTLSFADFEKNKKLGLDKDIRKII